MKKKKSFEFEIFTRPSKGKKGKTKQESYWHATHRNGNITATGGRDGYLRAGDCAKSMGNLILAIQGGDFTLGPNAKKIFANTPLW